MSSAIVSARDVIVKFPKTTHDISKCKFLFFLPLTKQTLTIFVLIINIAMQPLYINADTKVLNILSLNRLGFGSRYEVISLENVGTPEEELVVRGNRTTELGPPNSEGLIIMEITEYVADKTGYHVHTHIVAVPAAEPRLSSKALMSAAG